MEIAELIGTYITLRDKKEQVAKEIDELTRQKMEPILKPMELIENMIMHQMNVLHVDQLKAQGVGTAFKKNENSLQTVDGQLFRQFVFKPAVDNIVQYLQNSGYPIRDADYEVIANMIRDMPMWDLVDFRTGKKGVVDYIANENTPVPGVQVNTVSKISIRRA